MRRIVIFSLGIIVIIGGVFFYKKSTSSTGSPTGIGSFFPSSKSNTDTPEGALPNISNTSGDAGTTLGDTVISDKRFTRLSADPVAGYLSFYAPVIESVLADPANPKAKPTTKTVQKHFIRYISQRSGYVYELEDGGVPLQITNIYIPNVYEGFFVNGAQTAILRFLRDDQQTIATYSVPVPPENKDGSRTQKEGVYLPDDITAVTPSADSSTVLRLTSTPSLTSLTQTTPINTKAVELFASPLREWIPTWSGKSIYLQTKASFAAPGYLYRLESKRLSRVLGDIVGLTTSVSPSNTFVLYSESTNRTFSTKLLNLKTGATKNIGLKILPEKCVWMKNDDLVCAGNSTVADGNYPDVWYMGTTHFSDEVYHIYTSSMIYDVLYRGDGQSFDMTGLSIDEETGTLYFIDKNTGYLWKTTTLSE